MRPSVLVVLWVALASVASAADPAGPVYMEEGDGETSLWVDLGGVGWAITDRAPLASLTPLVFGLGVAHRIGPARLGSRVHLYSGAGADRPAALLFGDLLAVEQVLAFGTWRPFWRLALGFGLDLQGTQRDLGSDGYFNSDNGPTGGIGVTHAWGFEVFMTERWFTRLEADIRVFGGAGRTTVIGGGHLGVGTVFQ